MIRRIIIGLGYGLLTLAVICTTIILVANGRGYSYNFKRHALVRNGLVIFDSLPTNALIKQDGQSAKRHTPYRTTLEEGSYKFEVSKPGYRSWSKALSIIASQVTFAQYILLIPNEPNIDALATPPQISALALSRDHHHLAYLGEADGAAYTIDTGSRQQVKLYSPRIPSGANGPEILSNIQWSDDASHLLIFSTFNNAAGPQSIVYVIASSGGEPTNLSAQYGFAFDAIKFAPGTWRQLYWISPEGLRRLDLESQSVSAVLAIDVRQTEVTVDRLIYVQQTGVGKALLSLDRSGKRQELIQALPDSPSYAVAAGSWRGNDYLGVIPSSTHVATLYSDIYGQNPSSQLISRQADHLAFSPDGRYLMTWAGKSASSYDFDRSVVGQKAVTYNFSWPTEPSSQSWLDNSHLTSINNGRLMVYEFDGANSVDLGPGTASIPASGVQDGRSILYTRGSQGKTQLAELELR